jgi:hypothetical protein
MSFNTFSSPGSTLDYLFRIIFYPVGRRFLWLLTLGRLNIDPDLDNVRLVVSGVVAFLGFVFLFVTILGIFAFFNN